MENIIDLKKVVVFQSNCQFHREGIVQCKAGENTITISNLTRLLDKSSVRVKGSGYGKIANIIIEKKFRSEVDKEKLKELKSQMLELQNQKNSIIDLSANLNKQKNMLSKASDRFAEEFPKWFSLGKIELDRIKQMEEHLEDQWSEIDKKLRDYDLDIKELDKSIQKIQNEINQIGYSGNSADKSYYEIILIIDAEKEGEFSINITYMVSNVYWEPFYDIIIGSNGKNATDMELSSQDVEIELMANIYNQSGVNWENVELEISTASVQPVKMDKPDPFNIDEYVRPPPSPMRAIGKSKKKAAHKADFYAQRAIPASELMEEEMGLFGEALPEAAPPPPPELETVRAEMSSDYGVQSYKLKTKYNIKSDKNPKPISLTKIALKSIKQYFWSVLSPERVLCNNKIKNGANLILPGNAKIYVGDEFIGETWLDKIAPYEEFKLGERISYDVKVEKELKAKKKQKEGAFKGKNLVSYHYEIKIQNLAGVKEDLIIYDRIPHSISEKIKVKITEMSVEPALNIMNVLKWVIDMGKVSNEKIISYKFDVIYEKDIKINPPLP